MRRKGVRFSESAQVRVGVVANGKAWNIGAEFRIRAAESRRRVAVTRAQRIRVPWQPVCLYAALVAVVLAQVCGLGQVRILRRVRNGKELKVFRGDRVDLTGEVVAGGRSSGIQKNRRIGREVATAFRHRRHHHAVRDVLIVAETFVVREEVGVVMHHGAADRATELVLLELFLPRRKVIVGVERVVAQELIQRSMHLIRT